MRRLRTLLLICLAATAVAAVAGALALSGSLARRGGEAAIAALTAPVTVELDGLGIPRIRADSAADAYRALGFVHAQERFFQMDMSRRAAAGTLAALFGPRAAVLDRETLPYGFVRRARETLVSLPRRHRRWLEAYAEGVNAGIADLGVRPPEYWLLGSRPARWEPEDSLLVVFALHEMLSNNHEFEVPQAVMAATLPPALVEFLTPSTMRFDRPLLATADDPSGGYRPLPVPGADVVDLRNVPESALPERLVDPPLIGRAASNQWAVGAALASDGRAILANDPHLDIALPNLFYRAELEFEGRAVRGVTVPGLPGVLIGASDDLAWGATVSYADQSDWIVVEADPGDPGRYLTPEGSEPFVVDTVAPPAGGRPVAVRRTRWGPVAATDGLGRPLVLEATWLKPRGVSLDILELPFAANVHEGVAILAEWAGPALSWSLVDAVGETGWIMNGPLPVRSGFDGAIPVARTSAATGWSGLHEPPVVTGSDRVLNANNRPLPQDLAASYGRIWTRSYRAHRIDALLASGARFSERDFAAMQLDTDASAYDPFRDLILEVVAGDESDPALAAARALALEWNGRADAASPAFRLLQHYYRDLLDAVLGPLLEPAFRVDRGFVYRWPLADEPLLRLIEERPPHLLPAGSADWNARFRAILSGTVESIGNGSGPPLATPWGEINRLDAAHPMAGLPLLGGMLSLPRDAQAGSAVSIRVAAPDRGAVFRLVVSPAAPEAGYLQMAGGQSGHFLSPHFRDQHADWAAGRPAPFLAGPAIDRFTLVPRR